MLVEAMGFEEMARKIEAACTAKKNPDLMLNAGTEAIAVPCSAYCRPVCLSGQCSGKLLAVRGCCNLRFAWCGENSMRFGIAVACMVALCSLSSTALAAGPGTELVGKWTGAMENYPGAENARELVIRADGSCDWSLPGKAVKAKCEYSSVASVAIETGAQRPSKVQLRLQDGKLTGTFTLYQSVTIYHITMKKN
jgi:hypothetical protein